MMKKMFTLLLLFMQFIHFACQKSTDPDTGSDIESRLKAVTDSVAVNTDVPGIVALVADHKRGINRMYTAGVSDIVSKTPMDSSYTFRIASCTKLFVGTVILQLVDEKKLALDDKLSKFFPEYPKADSVTINMLCNMTSGIYDYLADRGFLNSFPVDPLRVYTPGELTAVGFANPYYCSPGSGWNYSNTNTVLLGMIIEQITGQTLESEINRRLILPTQANHTGFLSSGTDFPGPHAKGYFFPDIHNYSEMTTSYDISRAWACGSMYSTPREMQKFTEKIVGGGFISDTLQARRLSEMTFAGGLFGSYGMCLLKRGSFYGHGGTLWGFTSVAFHSLEKNCTIIIYFNCDLETVYHPLTLFLRYADILYGKEF